MKVLDTTFLIDLLDGDKSTIELIDNEGFLVTTQISIYELLRGLFYENAPMDQVRRTIDILGELRVLPFDDNSLIRSAEVSAKLIKEGKRIPDCDCMIAGTALANGIKTIVTRNKDHFSRIKGITVETY